MRSSSLRSAATSILIAAVLVTVVWLVARASGDDLRITPFGRDEPAKMPVFSPALFTVGIGLIGTGVAILFRRRGWSSPAFYGVVALFLIVLGIMALGPAETTGTAIWLNVMHLVAAAAIAPPLGRMLDRSV